MISDIGIGTNKEGNRSLDRSRCRTVERVHSWRSRMSNLGLGANNWGSWSLMRWRTSVWCTMAVIRQVRMLVWRRVVTRRRLHHVAKGGKVMIVVGECGTAPIVVMGEHCLGSVQ